jgi:hypothetical protein
VSLSAQRLGFIGGYQTISTYAVVSGKSVDFNPNIGSGFHAGGYFELDFKKGILKNFGFDAQVLYALRSTKFNLHYFSDTTTIFERQAFTLEVPVHLYYNWKLNDKFILTPFLGASLNMGLHAKDLAWENTDWKKPVDMQKTEMYSKDGRINRFELAGDIGFALKYKQYGFRTTYQAGFTNLTNKKFDWTLGLSSQQNKYLFNRELKFSLTYTFDLKSKY